MSGEEAVVMDAGEPESEASIPCGIGSCTATFETEAEAARHRKEEHSFWA